MCQGGMQGGMGGGMGGMQKSMPQQNPWMTNASGQSMVGIPSWAAQNQPQMFGGNKMLNTQLGYMPQSQFVDPWMRPQRGRLPSMGPMTTERTGGMTPPPPRPTPYDVEERNSGLHPPSAFPTPPGMPNPVTGRVTPIITDGSGNEIFVPRGPGGLQIDPEARTGGMTPAPEKSTPFYANPQGPQMSTPLTVTGGPTSPFIPQPGPRTQQPVTPGGTPTGPVTNPLGDGNKALTERGPGYWGPGNVNGRLPGFTGMGQNISMDPQYARLMLQQSVRPRDYGTLNMGEWTIPMGDGMTGWDEQRGLGLIRGHPYMGLNETGSGRADYETFMRNNGSWLTAMPGDPYASLLGKIIPPSGGFLPMRRTGNSQFGPV